MFDRRFGVSVLSLVRLWITVGCIFGGGFSIVLSADNENLLERYEFSAEKMGVPVHIILFAESEGKAETVATAIWQKFDELNSKLSDYDPESEIIQVCRKSTETGDYVQISDDLRLALTESRRYCELTNGAFDATVSPIVKLWRRSRYFHEVPPKKTLESAKNRVGLNVWTIDERGVKTNKDVRFDVGGIAKGIAMDEALKIACELGVRSILVDASGDLRLGDAPPNAAGWRVGVSSLTDEPAVYCVLSNVGICTSGDANRYVKIDGVRYSHIIDPRTFTPLTRRCVATVLAPTATTADALASSLCILGGTEFEKIAKHIRTISVKEGMERTEPLEYLLIQVANDSEPPYTDDKVEVFSSPFFSELLDNNNRRF